MLSTTAKAAVLYYDLPPLQYKNVHKYFNNQLRVTKKRKLELDLKYTLFNLMYYSKSRHEMIDLRTANIVHLFNIFKKSEEKSPLFYQCLVLLLEAEYIYIDETNPEFSFTYSALSFYDNPRNIKAALDKIDFSSIRSFYKSALFFFGFKADC